MLGNKERKHGNPAEARDVKTGALISKAGHLRAATRAVLASASMDDVDGNSSPEYVVMVLRTATTTRHRVQVRDVP